MLSQACFNNFTWKQKTSFPKPQIIFWDKWIMDLIFGAFLLGRYFIGRFFLGRFFTWALFSWALFSWALFYLGAFFYQYFSADEQLLQVNSPK